MPSFLANQKSNIGAKQPSNTPIQAPNQNPIIPPQNVQNRPINMATYLKPGQTNLTNPNAASWRKN